MLSNGGNELRTVGEGLPTTRGQDYPLETEPDNFVCWSVLAYCYDSNVASVGPAIFWTRYAISSLLR